MRGPAGPVPVREDRAAERCPQTGSDRATLLRRQAWSTIGPQPIGAEPFPTVSSGASFSPRRYDLKLWIGSLRERATYPPA
jgi:hypothetical protein